MQEPITIRDRNRYFRGTDESILITPIHIGVNISDENTTTAISWNGVTSQRESYTWKSKNTRFYTDDRLWTVSYRLCSDLCFVTYLPPVMTSTTELGLATAHEADQQPSLICGRSANWPEVLYKLTCVDKIIVTRAPQRCLIPDLLHIQRLAMPISLHTLPNWDRIFNSLQSMPCESAFNSKLLTFNYPERMGRSAFVRHVQRVCPNDKCMQKPKWNMCTPKWKLFILKWLWLLPNLAYSSVILTLISPHTSSSLSPSDYHKIGVQFYSQILGQQDTRH